MIYVKKYAVFLFHLGLSLLIPFLISIAVLDYQRYPDPSVFSFFQTLFFLTCSIPMLFMLFLAPFSSSEMIMCVFYVTSILLRLSMLIFFVFLHKKNKIAGIIFDIVFILITILLGLLFELISSQ